MGTQITELDSFKKALVALEPRLAPLLPKEVSVAKFNEVVGMAIGKNKDLLSVNRDTLFYEILECAKDQLVPDGKEAAILKYVTKAGPVAKYIPMIKGVNKKLHATGQVKDINQEIVYENDYFNVYTKAGEKVIDHAPAKDEKGHPLMVGERGSPKFCFVVIRTINGGTYQEVMDREEIEKVRSKAKTKNVWDEWQEEMWKKTVTKRLAKRCNFAKEIQEFLDRDNFLYDLTPQKQPPQPRGNRLERLLEEDKLPFEKEDSNG